MTRQETGQYGEYLARVYLREAGYRILAGNWHCRWGEIDIVAQYGDVLIFVEVRTRHAATTDAAFSSIDPAKQSRMVKAAYQYLADHALPTDVAWRIDVIAVALTGAGHAKVEHVEDALDWPG